ncbi:MAG: DUF1552 domain-containing protein [Polyangiaceae bacterium]
MPNFRLSRRAVLRGAGGIAIALPFLEIMGVEKARAASAPAKRFLTVFQPGGTVTYKDANATMVDDRFWPTGSETAMVMNKITAPLAAVQSKLLFIDGLRLGPASTGEQHQEGIVGLLTGAKQTGGGGTYANTASIDQVLRQRFNDAGYKQSSLEMAVRWATGKSQGRLSPINSMNFEFAGSHSPIPPQIDPQEIFKMFSSLTKDTTGTADLVTARKKSILDFVDKRYVALSARLGAADKAKLDAHLTKLREMETSLTTVVAGSAVCKSPVKVDTTGYNPKTGLQSALDGSIVDISTDTLIPKVGTFMMDMMVMAMACDLTRVGTLQWSDTEAKHTFPWLSLMNHHHYYQHDNGYQPEQLTTIGTWYCKQHAYLISEMDKVDMGGHTLLDESVVFFGSELAHPPVHKKVNMPFFLAGKGGGLNPGRHVKIASGRTSNDLLVSILNLFGDTRSTYGEASFNKGPLSGLTI